jgi:hypothetical protein
VDASDFLEARIIPKRIETSGSSYGAAAGGFWLTGRLGESAWRTVGNREIVSVKRQWRGSGSPIVRRHAGEESF